MISDIHHLGTPAVVHSEAIAERIKSLCQKSSYFRERVHEIKTERASLEERRRKLLKHNQKLDGDILKCQASIEEATSQCHALMKRTGALKEKLVLQAKRKRDLQYANLWIRTGTACCAVFHILRLREDLQKLKSLIFSTKTSQQLGAPDTIVSTDKAIASGLQKMAELTESNLAALAKETSLPQPGRLTYCEKTKVKKLLSAGKLEGDEPKLLLLTLLLCATNRLDIPEHISLIFQAHKEDYYGTRHSKQQQSDTCLAQMPSDASTPAESSGNHKDADDPSA